MSNFLTFRAANPIGCIFPIIIMIVKTFIGKIIHRLIKKSIKMVVKMRRCYLKKPLMTFITLSRSSKTANRYHQQKANLFLRFFSKIMHFYFIGVFPEFLDTPYVRMNILILK
jgi:hypothetical protein